MLPWHSRLLGFTLALFLLFSSVPTAGNTADAAGETVSADVSLDSATYSPGSPVTVTIELQNNQIRRMRADVHYWVTNPNGIVVHERAWQNVRTASTIQLTDGFQAGSAPGDYSVGIEVSQSTQVYVAEDTIASFNVVSEQQPEPTIEPTATVQLDPTTQPSPTAEPEPAGVLFGVYPGGGNGEFGYVEPPAPEVVIAKLDELRGDQAFDIHLYTAWSWYNRRNLSNEIAQYTSAGMYVTLTVKYSPPEGREGDIDGFAAFVKQVVNAHAADPMVHRIVIGNEINVVNGNPGSSDGPFSGVNEATIAGVLAARASLNAMDREATQVGISLAVLERETDARFLQGLADFGGDRFRSTIDFMGLNVYPGMWPVGTGDPYADMVTHLENGRYSLSTAGFSDDVALAVLENGYPTPDASLQLSKIDGFLQAVCDASAATGVTSYSWFDLWDANSASDSPYAHYGLLRSDMTEKPSFDHFRNVIADGCAG